MGTTVTIGAFSHEVLADPAPEAWLVPNVEWIDTAGGYPRAVVWGGNRHAGAFAFKVNASDLSTFNTMLGTAVPATVSVTDHEGNTYTARIIEHKKSAYNPTHTLITISVEEVPAP